MGVKVRGAVFIPVLSPPPNIPRTRDLPPVLVIRTRGFPPTYFTIT